MRAPPEAAKSTNGRLLLDGGQHAGDDRLAGGHAERAAHEVEILHRGDDRHVLDGAGADLHGVVGAGLGAGVAQPVGVAPLVAELQRVERHVGQRRSSRSRRRRRSARAAAWSVIRMW